jgi:hypothetical protein
MPLWSWNASLVAVALIVASAQASAQMQSPQPYAGLQSRAIKALSPQDRADLTAGRGMGLALPAELNGYPGPAHVLDLADQLGLTEQQRTSVKQLFDSMKGEAIPLGQKLIAAESALDREFAERTITPERLKAATAAIGAIRGELRNTHLKYHLSTAALLSPDQIRRYVELRGYGGTAVAAGAASGPAHGAMHGPMQHPMMGSKGN